MFHISLRIILTPILGGIIGYITNDIAIKMLFHPREAVYIGKWHVPMTPGLIPQQKGRIAASVGRMVNTKLLNEETVKASVLSDEAVGSVRSFITKKIDSFQGDERTVEAFVCEFVGEEQLNGAQDKLTENASKMIIDKLLNADLGNVVIKYINDDENAKKAVIGINLLPEKTRRNIGDKLSEIINDLIKQKAPDILKSEIDKAINNIRNERICDLIEKYRDKIDDISEHLIELYRTVVGDNLGKVLQAINIEKIVENKVASFSAEELENLIFGLMKRELTAIIYLGAALGFIMGFINIGIMYLPI